MEVKKFQNIVWQAYRHHGRSLPWRTTHNPYCILVSEVMLQQTQVVRVAEKYRHFLKTFPTSRALAAAPVRDVLAAWQGLGYNRRALMLKRAAEKIQKDWLGKIPPNPELLATLPGIGKNTAAAICAYAYNLPVPFIETNIRRVFIHHFFPGRGSVSDAEILPLVAKTIPKDNAREWFQALMDYGSLLPKTVANPNRRSKHYTKQSKFEGSLRQLRGKIISHLVSHGPQTMGSLAAATGDLRLSAVLAKLQKDGFIRMSGNKVALA